MRRALSIGSFVLLIVAGVVFVGTHRSSAQEARQPGGSMPGHQLVVYSDMAIFLGPGKDENCTLRNRYKRGEPVGWRADAIDSAGNRIDKDSELIVHLSYAGKTEDIKMRWRATANQPERQFWVAKWIVPDDVPTGIVRYTITAKDASGRTGLFKPFEVDASQLTIIQ